ncbi:MAG: hypothetical protein R3F14_47885, partial [Polyangiaceae bacterium]
MAPLPFLRRSGLPPLLLFAGAVFSACAAGHASSQVGGDGGGTTTQTGGGGTGGTDLVGGFTATGGAEDPPPTIYIHTNTTLYEADPSQPDLAVTEIGPIDCIGGAGEDTSLTDLAVSASGEIWGISKTNVFRLEISGSTVLCTKTIPLNNPQD